MAPRRRCGAFDTEPVEDGGGVGPELVGRKLMLGVAQQHGEPHVAGLVNEGRGVGEPRVAQDRPDALDAEEGLAAWRGCVAWSATSNSWRAAMR